MEETTTNVELVTIKSDCIHWVINGHLQYAFWADIESVNYDPIGLLVIESLEEKEFESVRRQQAVPLNAEDAADCLASIATALLMNAKKRKGN